MIIYGAGYNDAFLSHCSNKNLEVPGFVTFIELGLAEYKKLTFDSFSRKFDLSLHLARTPITEEDHVQDLFIRYLQNELTQNSQISINNLTSIGLHLTGKRHEGIGRFGFSSHFLPSQESKKQAVRFIKKLNQALHLPIWIENASFYSRSRREILETWEIITDICKTANAGLIVDLAHLYINAKNISLDPLILLGAVPWKFLSEIHLSGIIQSHDGVFHDGHSEAVHNEIWNLLTLCLNELIHPDKDLVLTIEHTAPLWNQKQETYSEDFFHLYTLSKTIKDEGYSKSDYALVYAKNYLKKLLRQWLPTLVNDMEKRKVNFDTIFEHWLQEVFFEQKRIVMTIEEIPVCERDSVYIATESFTEFAKKEMLAC